MSHACTALVHARPALGRCAVDVRGRKTADGVEHRVVEQIPPAGTLLRRGASVSLVVERPRTTCVVPALSQVAVKKIEDVEEVLATYEKAIEAAGLVPNVRVHGKGVSAWTIVDGPMPPEGQSVECGAVVSMTLGPDLR